MPSLSIALILDTCVEDIRSGKATLQECREQYSQQWSELEPLLHLTLRLQQARQVQVSPEYRLVAAARMRNLVAAHPRGSPIAALPANRPRSLLTVQETIRSNGLWGRQLASGPANASLRSKRFLQGRLAGLATILTVLVVTLLAGTVTAYASAQSLPGEALYPLKTTIETARLALSPTEAGDARLHILFAARRLQEATTCLERDQPEHAEQAFEGYVAHVTSTVENLEKSVEAPQPEHEALARALAVELASQQGQLATLLVDTSAGTLEAAESALAASREGQARVWALVDELPDVPRPGSPVVATGTATSAATGTASPVPTATPSTGFTWTPSPSPAATATAISTSQPIATHTPQGPAPTLSSTPSGPAAATPIPIELPTDVPKEWLTRMATRWPTAIPTAWPTAWPTGVPTGWPAEVPTGWPTGEPTEWSTGWPTAVPTWWPTQVPTAWPIEVPTAWPTAWPIPIPIPPLPPLPDLPPAPPGW